MQQWHNQRAESLTLDGAWQLELAGQRGTVTVPGCWEAQGFARRVEGPATFQRSVHIPAAWHGRRVQLQFDAVSYYAEVTVNAIPVGTHTGSWTAFACDVTGAIRPGQDNTIRLAVYKPGERFGLREALAGFLPDVAVMFGGIWQSARLVAFDGPALSDLTLLSDAQTGGVQIRTIAQEAEGRSVTIRLLDPAGCAAVEWQGAAQDGQIAAALTVDQPALWEPEHPHLYTAEIRVGGENEPGALVQRRFGFRTLTHQAGQLLFNGVPVNLRGILNWGWYPEILCPAPDEAAIRDEFRRVRALGYNLVKLCLYVPAPLYFTLADEEGMLLWLELPLWLPEMTPHLRAQAPAQYADIMAQVHPHPSVVIYSLGCELERHVDAAWIAELNRVVRGQAGQALVCDNSGSGEAYGYQGDLADFYDYHFYADLQFFGPLMDHFDRNWRERRPWIFGEFCDADDYRDLNDLLNAYGGALPWWATEQNPIHPLSKLAYSQQAARMAALNLGLTGQELTALSYRQSYMIRKTILEAVRARDNMGGYVVTSLRNTPLATSSMFDDFGRNKYDPEAFRMINADTVLLLGRGRARRWTWGGDRPAPAEPYSFAAGQPVVFDLILAHAGPDLPGGRLSWRVTRPDGFRCEGEHPVAGPLTGGRPRSLAQIAFDAPETAQAVTLELEAALELDGQTVRNRWTLWVFPPVTRWPAGIGLIDPCGGLAQLDDLGEAAARLKQPTRDLRTIITNVLTGEIRDFLRSGGSVLLLQQGDCPLPARPLPFWREAIKLIADHPAMNALPHAGFVDLQFYGLATDWALETGRLGEALPDAGDPRPLLRRLDARQFTVTDYLVEVPVGAGRLIASTLRFQGGLGDQPVGLSAQLAGRWLMAHLLHALE